MFASWQLLLLATAYLGALFTVAWFAERSRAGQRRARPYAYALALAVYCTAWTFYGAVGRAADDGWSYLPIYLGPALVFLLGTPFLRRLIVLCKRQRLTSVADFVAARYGRDPRLAVAVTAIALLAGLPYLALQLRGISLGFEVLASDGGMLRQGMHGTTLITVLLAAFAMLVGTRHIEASESHEGMVRAVAVESVVKLLAFIAVGWLAVHWLGGPAASLQAVRAAPQLDAARFSGSAFWVQTLLAAAAVIVLPRQFHLTVVENSAPAELKTARWLFPLYLMVFALFVLPLAVAGTQLVAGGGVLAGADRIVLALPLLEGAPVLALLAFIGGFSAATGMVIVSCVALATMISNEILLPAMLRGGGYQRAERDLGALLRRLRRLTIAGLLLAAWLIDRLLYAQLPLAAIGLLSFSAIAHLAPPVIAGVLWPRANRAGASLGLLGGVGLWLVLVLLPSLMPGADIQALVVNGSAWSLAVHALLLVLVSLLTTPSLTEQSHTAHLTGEDPPETTSAKSPAVRVSDLQVLLERFFGSERAQAFLEDYENRKGSAQAARGAASPGFARFCEARLAGALGAASARVLIERLSHPGPGEVIELIEQTSRAVRFNRELLQATLDNMEQGVSVVDADLRLIAWNRAYARLFDFPEALLQVGTPAETLTRYLAERGLLGDGDIDAVVASRTERLRAGRAYRHERELPDGRVIQVHGNPMPDGGFVSTFSDVTDYQHAQRMLHHINIELEERVASRTRALMAANDALRDENDARARAEAEARRARAAAERANQSKTRFLAASSHDLAQPLNAARLFNHSLEDVDHPGVRDLSHHIGRSLAAMETLVDGLRDISRLDSGAQSVQRQAFPIQRLLDTLTAEFGALAKSRGLALNSRPCSAWVESDARLLRRIVQNLLSNALRYTPRGRVLLGCRRHGEKLLLEVWDTGPGIPEDKRELIFEEFQRLSTPEGGEPAGERGLGLGLAISDRLTRLLRHELSLQSTPGKGSVFRIALPRRPAQPGTPTIAPTATARATDLSDQSVLCLDNDPDSLKALRELLQRWHCEVRTAATTEEALRLSEPRPAILLLDYQLDDGDNGIEAWQRLRRQWPDPPPAVLVTARTEAETRAAAAAAGMAFLAKPVKPAALRAVLSRLLPAATGPKASAGGPEAARR